MTNKYASSWGVFVSESLPFQFTEFLHNKLFFFTKRHHFITATKMYPRVSTLLELPYFILTKTSQYF